MDLPNVDQVLDEAVSVIMNSMTQPTLWRTVSEVFGKFLGRGRSRPDAEQRKLETDQHKVLASESSEADTRDVVAKSLRDRIETVVELRAGAGEELAKILQSLQGCSSDSSTSKVKISAEDGSVAQAAGRDFVAGGQTFILGNAESHASPNPH